MKLTRYSFKTKSIEDPRPERDFWKWVAIAATNEYWHILCWLEDGESIFDYWSDAYEVSLLKEDVQLVRGGITNIIPNLNTDSFVNGVDYFTKKINPHALYLISELAMIGESDSVIAKKLKMSYNRFKYAKQNNAQIMRAYENGKTEYLKRLKKDIEKVKV